MEGFEIICIYCNIPCQVILFIIHIFRQLNIDGVMEILFVRGGIVFLRRMQ